MQSSVGFSSSQNEVDLDSLRPRLCKMNDAELKRFGQAAKYMCSVQANMRKPPRQVFVIQLEEAEAEWERRHGSSHVRLPAQ